MWSKLVEELEPIGFVLATVHSEHERELARKVGVRELPHLLLLTDGKVSGAGWLQLWTGLEIQPIRIVNTTRTERWGCAVARST